MLEPFLGPPPLDRWLRVMIKVGTLLVLAGLLGQRVHPNPWWALPLGAGVGVWLIALSQLPRRRSRQPGHRS
jgi:hypothetical protein